MPSLTLTDQSIAASTTGSDSSALVLGTQEPSSHLTNCSISANGGNWGLKMPGNVGSVIKGCRLSGGAERALDIVQGSEISFEDCVFSSGADRAPTSSRWSFAKTCDIGIKGGADDIAFNRCTMTDMLLGDHSIYDNPSGLGARTAGIVLTDCGAPNGAPIILRVLNADLPTLVRTRAVALVYYRWVVRTYFWVAGKWIDSRLPSA